MESIKPITTSAQIELKSHNKEAAINFLEAFVKAIKRTDGNIPLIGIKLDLDWAFEYYLELRKSDFGIDEEPNEDSFNFPVLKGRTPLS